MRRPADLQVDLKERRWPLPICRRGWSWSGTVGPR